MQVEWGHHSVTAAMRLLLAAAVADPANQRFQFLDETSIPLYPPHLVWAQFMHETKTRMSACEVISALSPQCRPSAWLITRSPVDWAACLASQHAVAVSGAFLSLTVWHLQSQVSRVQWVPQLQGPHLQPSMWRKTSQWSMILRHHAEVLPPVARSDSGLPDASASRDCLRMQQNLSVNSVVA
jgi:hypothetical protein